MINDDTPDTHDDDLFDDVDFEELPPAGEYRLTTRRPIVGSGS